jgi:hypothetical protein|tara:strand:+ start:674 stop:856 length:183 start_codon:yes stop_codon:yes gene_type:complete
MRSATRRLRVTGYLEKIFASRMAERRKNKGNPALIYCMSGMERARAVSKVVIIHSKRRLT